MDEALEKRIWEMFEQGLSDNEILDQIVSEEGKEVTYMDLRVLRADYEAEHPESIEDEEKEEIEEEGPEEPETGRGETVVEIDAVKRPGALLSGTASLPSGATIVWMLDQYGKNRMRFERGDDGSITAMTIDTAARFERD